MRQSRHYADLALLAKAPFAMAAVADTDLLLDVARHKSTYFSSASARYDLARPGSLRLVPSDTLIEDLQKRLRADERNVHYGSPCVLRGDGGIGGARTPNQ